MKHHLGPVYVLATIAILACACVQAETGEKMVIALATDDFELAGTDISTLNIGEAKTIETENGKIIDILRTAESKNLLMSIKMMTDTRSS